MRQNPSCGKWGLRIVKCSLPTCRTAGVSLLQFSHCDFSGAALQSMALVKSAFDACRLSDVQLTGTLLNGLDLTSCAIEGWSLRGEELRGAIVTPFQAAELSRLFGLVIREGEG